MIETLSKTKLLIMREIRKNINLNEINNDIKLTKTVEIRFIKKKEVVYGLSRAMPHQR